MLWADVMLELQSNLAVGIKAANQAGHDLDSKTSKVNEHRTAIRWGDVARIWESDSGRTEGPDGPDISVMRNMRNQNAWWLSSALEVKAQVDTAVEVGADGILKPGYKGEF